jgi:hypothetical protein
MVSVIEFHLTDIISTRYLFSKVGGGGESSKFIPSTFSVLLYRTIHDTTKDLTKNNRKTYKCQLFNFM